MMVLVNEDAYFPIQRGGEDRLHFGQQVVISHTDCDPLPFENCLVQTVSLPLVMLQYVIICD